MPPSPPAARLRAAARLLPAVLGAWLAVLLALPGLAGAQPRAAQRPPRRAAIAMSGDWTATVVVAPSPSPFLADWERNPSTAVLTVAYTGTAPVDFRLEAYARGSRGEVGRVRSPALSLPGGPATQVFTSADVLDWETVSKDAGVVSTVLRTGVLPEGRYQLCARVVGAAGEALGEGCADLEVALPDAPQLIYPANGAVVSTRMPVFQWTPTPALPGVDLRYRIRIVQRLAQQTPQQALAAPAFAAYTATVNGPLAVYPPDAIALRAGNEYAWQVTPVDAAGNPVSRGGKGSEIWTFKATDDVGVGAPIAALLDSVDLVPDAVRLSGLRGATVTESETAYTVSGQLTLEFRQPFVGRATVTATNLQLDRSALPNVRILGGRLHAAVPPSLVPATIAGAHVRFTDVEWTPAKGLTFGGALRLPALADLPFAQRVRLTKEGLEGTLSLDRTLTLAGEDPFRLAVTRATVRFPDVSVELKGGMELFGENAKCSLVFGALSDSGTVAVTPRCLASFALPIAGGETGLTVQLRNLGGTILLDLPARKAHHDLTATADLRIGAGSSCGARFDLRVKEGVAGFGNQAVRCDATEGEVGLGWLTAALSGLRVEKLDYDSRRAGRKFDFAFTLDLQPRVADTARAGFPLPAFASVRMTPDGVFVPAADAPVTGTPLVFGPLRITPEQVSSAAITVPWSAWGKLLGEARGRDDGRGLGARFAFGFRAAVALDSAGVGLALPPCLTTSRLLAPSGRLTQDELRLELGGQAFPAGCVVTLSPTSKFGLEVSRLGGGLVVRDGGVVAAGDGVLVPELSGKLVLPDLFGCAAAGKAQVLELARPLRLVKGGVSGTLTGLAPACPIALPAVQLTAANGTLTLDVRDGRQGAVLAADAQATFALGQSPIRGRGSLALDLVAGKLLRSNVEFDGPFRLDLPREQPVMSFAINRARLDSAGLLIDGRNRLDLGPGRVINTTFDKVVLNPASGWITGGRVSFDVPFALQAEIADGALTYKTVAAGSALDLTTGVRLDLPRAVTLGPGGLEADGKAKARLRYEGRDLEDLAADFRQQFSAGLKPFGVQRGRVEFADSAGTQIAAIDRLGFHPNLNYFANRLLPAKLPLPDTLTAYVELREPGSGRIRVRVDTTADGLRLRTNPGQVVALRMPALKLGGAAEPALDVALDVTVGGDGQVKVGRVAGRVPEAQRATFEMMSKGLPVAFDTVSYERKGSDPFRFFLGGRLVLFDRGQTKPGSVTLALDGDGRLSGSVNVRKQDWLDDMLIPMEVSRFRLEADSVVGRFDVNLKTGALKYALDIDAEGMLAPSGDNVSQADFRLRLHATDRVTEVTDVRIVDNSVDRAPLDLGGVLLSLSTPRIPLLRYDHARKKFDWEMVFDVGLKIPALDSLALPVIKDVSVRDDGFSFPAWSVPDLSKQAFAWQGFQVRPIAFRLPKTRVPFDGAGGRHAQWGFKFDLAIKLADGGEVPGFLQNMELSVLDAGLVNGKVVGRIEQREVEGTIKVAEKVAVQVKKLYGQISDPEWRDSVVNAVKDSAQAALRREARALNRSLIDLYVEGDVSLGALGQCGDTARVQVATASLHLHPTGTAEGTVRNFVPRCPIQLGPVAITPGNSVLGIGVPYDKEGVYPGRTKAWLRTDATASMPGVNPNTTVNARGMVSLELTEPKLIDGYLALAEPFRIDLPAKQPVFTFHAERGRLDARGLTVTGGAKLALDAGRFIGADLKNVTFDPRTMDVTAGEATFLGKFALSSAVGGDGGLTWKAVDTTAARPQGAAFKVVLPDTLTLSRAGLTLRGAAGASLSYNDTTFAEVRTRFRDGFTLALGGDGAVPVRVARGRLDFRYGGRLFSDVRAAYDSALALGASAKATADSLKRRLDSLRVAVDDAARPDTGSASLVAHVDSTGFWPGNVFGVLPIPAKLGLADTAVAYLRLRDPATNQLLVESGSQGGNVYLRTTSPAGVQLVIPALAKKGKPAPAVPVRFDVIVNPASMKVVSGDITADADSAKAAGGALFDLVDFGVPMKVRKVRYRKDKDGPYRLALGGRVQLPKSLDSLKLDFDDLSVTKAGVSGTASLGEYREAYDSAAKAVVVARLRAEPRDTLTLHVYGARATFDGDSAGVRIAGAVKSSMFAKDTTYAPFFFTAFAGPDGFRAAVDPGRGGSRSLPIGLATFDPQPLGGRPAVELTAADDEFAVRVSGVLKVPAFGPEFQLAVEGLKVGTRGIDLPAVSLTGDRRVDVRMFGARLTLSDSTAGARVVYPAVTLGRADGVVSLTMTGQLEFLNNTARFQGLRVTTRGDVSLAAANLLSQPVQIVQNRLTLDSLLVRDQKLRASLLVNLPAPFDSAGGQRVSFAVARDGTMEGGANVVLVKEKAGLATATRKVDLGIATTHLRYAGLNLDFASRENSALEIVGDVYLQGKDGNRIMVGRTDGDLVRPGLRVGFDGDVRFANIALADTFNFDFDALKLSIHSVSAPETQDGFEVAFGGKLSVNLPSVRGGLGFEDFAVTSRGDVRFKPENVTGGELEVAGAVRLDVSGFAFSRTPTTIKVAGGTMPKPGSAAKGDSTSVAVTSFARFGGTIDVQNVLAGGVKEVLFYKTADGETQFLVREAKMSVNGVIDLAGDFRYRQAGRDFEMLLGARGQILKGPGLAFVGLVAKEGPTTRLGVFAAASGLQVPLVPGVVMLTDVGGGFFLNPKPEYVQIVRSLTGLSDASNGKVEMAENDRFAIMLYGGASITPAAVVKGRVLATVTPSVVMLDGDLTVLNQGNKLRGTGHLAVGLKRPYAEGRFALAVDYAPVVTGEGDLEFYVYSNTWGVKGRSDLELMKLVNARSSLFVGPSGFMAKMDFAMKPLFIITFKNTRALAYYRTAGSEWGVAASLGVSVAPLGPVLEVTGTLEGALIREANKAPWVYAVAELEARVLMKSWKGSVWAALRDGDLDGGLGRNEALDAVIARAAEVGEEMEAARQEGEAAVAEARRAAGPEQVVALSPEELTATYQRIQGWSEAQYQASRALALDGLENAYFPQPGQEQYFNWYLDVLRQQGAPADTAAIRGMTEEVRARQRQLAERQSLVTTRLREVRAAVDAMNAPGGAAAALRSAIADTSFADPVTRTEVVNGDTVKVAVSEPGFRVDAGQEAALQAELGRRERALAERDGEVKRRLAALEDGLARVRAVTSATDSASLLAYARLHGTVVEAAERQFAHQADQIMRKQDWMRFQVGRLAERRPALDAILAGKNAALAAYYGECANLSPDALGDEASYDPGDENPVSAQEKAARNARIKKAREAQRALVQKCLADNSPKRLARRRAEALQAWGGPNVSVLAQFDQAAAGKPQFDPFFTNQADTFGRQLWSDIAGFGMQLADRQADTALVQHRARVEPTRQAIRGAHGQLSASLARLYADQAELAGVLYDAYDVWLGEKTAGGAALPADLAPFDARRLALRADLTPPRVTDARVTLAQTGYVTTARYDWAGWHPNGTYEHAFNDVAGTQSAGSEAVYSNGPAGAFTNTFVAPARGAAAEPRTLQVSVRGGAGYAGSGRATYALPSVPAGGAWTAAAVAGQMADDATPPYAPTVEVPGLPMARLRDGTLAAWAPAGRQAFGVAWGSADPESGIHSYEWAVGTTRGGTDLRPWTGVGGRRTMTLTADTLGGGGRVWISVRATNGRGLVGPAGSAMLARDTTPPAFASLASAVPPRAALAPGAEADVQLRTAAACQVEGDSLAPANRWDGSFRGAGYRLPAQAPRMTLRVPQATDAESDVPRTYFIVDTVPHTAAELAASGALSQAAPLPGLGWRALDPYATEARLGPEVGLLDHERRWYVSFVAVNGAGLASAAAHVVGPFEVPDATPPHAPNVCAGVGTGGNRFAVLLGAVYGDGETSTVGYEYRVRRADGAVVRDWPAGAPDWAAPQGGQVRQTAELPLAPGRYVVDVRAVNGAGLKSGYVTSGPLTVDPTGPTAPAVSNVVWERDAQRSQLLCAGQPTYADGLGRLGCGQYVVLLRVDDAAGDAESGVVTHEVAVGTTRGATDLLDWSPTRGGWSNDPTPAPGYYRFYLPWQQVRALGVRDRQTLYVTVRGRNRGGAPGAAVTVERRASIYP